MTSKVDITFKMNADDLTFLMWAMEFVEGGPHDRAAELKEWHYQFRRALDDHFEEITADEKPSKAGR
jgi:hypothetical protein